MLSSFLASLGLIFLAELGDKTNFLVLYFATRYRLKTVVLPVFSAIFLLEGAAVFLGSFFREIFPRWLSALASGLVFLVAFFWLWSNREEEEEKTEKFVSSSDSFRQFLVIFSSFFLAEFGDKTQLGTLALAARFKQPLMVLLGGTLGMFLPNFLFSLFGEKIAGFSRIKLFHRLGAVLFLVFAFLSFLECFHLFLG